MPDPKKITRYFKVFALIVMVMLIGATCSQESAENTEETRSELIQPNKWWESLPRPVYDGLEKVDTSQIWYEVYRLTEDTYAIYEPYQFEEAICYLAVGEEGGIVIDTGTGLGDLKAVITELTTFPVTVVNTHTHWDHVGANSQFDDIACYNHPECIKKLTDGVSNRKLHPSLAGDSVWKPLPKHIDPETWSIPPVQPSYVFEDGHIFDLGNRRLEVIYTPGHSPGSVCLLDSKNRILFTGDTFFPGPLYAHPEDVNISDYIASIQKMETRLPEYDHVCAGHNDPWVESEVIRRVSKAFTEVMNGGGSYKEDRGLRRYRFAGFDILIRSDQIAHYQKK
ncbi:MAG: MBL fold metallo-hydrolase [Candidatus Aminicenantes bacterium]|jgi:glyoxylase-like metal-dependent hydrolase (beta-lactamase superfamily II)